MAAGSDVLVYGRSVTDAALLRHLRHFQFLFISEGISFSFLVINKLETITLNRTVKNTLLFGYRTILFFT
jgi:hypothetical protein